MKCFHAYLIFCFCISVDFLFGQPTITTVPSTQGDTVFVCVNQSVTFIAVDTNWVSWEFTGGTPATSTDTVVTVSYASNGVFTATLIDSSGPNNSVFVKVGSPTSVTFSPSQTSFCVNDPPFDLSSSVTPVGGTFSGPGVSGSMFDPQTAGVGTHTIIYTFTNNFGCVSSETINFDVNQTPPFPNFSSTGLVSTTTNGVETYRFCSSNLNHTFNLNFAQIPDSTYSYFELMLNGVIIDSGIQLSSPYPINLSSPGIYSVTLEISNANGCKSSKTINLFYGTNPSISLGNPGNTIACLPLDGSGLEYRFPISGFSNNSDGTIYIVEVNDGTPSITYSHPPPDTFVHVFNQSSCNFNTFLFQNSFFVRITASNPCGTSVASVEPIVVSKPPEADFDVLDTVCKNTNVTIQNTSINGLNAAGGQGSVLGPNLNCDSTGLIVWEISPPNFLPSQGSLGDRFGSNDPSNWSSGSNTLEGVFQDTGIYTIKLIVGNSSDCGIDSIIKTICVDAPPSDAEISISFINDTSFCTPFSMGFNDLGDSSVACATNIWEWDISPNIGFTIDSASLNDKYFEATFNTAGVYTVSLTKSNECGSMIVDTTFTVAGEPTLDMPPAVTYCGPQIISFDALEHMPVFEDSLSDLSFQWTVKPDSGWTFLAPSLSTDTFPTIHFTDTGSYWVVLQIQNECGSMIDSQQVVILNPPVLTSITDTFICFGDSFVYEPLRSFGAAPFSFYWTAGAISDSSSVISIPNVTDTLLIKYMVVDVLGCADSITILVIPYPPVELAISAPSFLCESDSAVLDVVATGGSGGDYSYQWTPPNGLSDPNIRNPVLFANAAANSYQVLVTDSTGCFAVDTVSIDIIPLPPVLLIPDVSICIGDSIAIGDSAIAGLNYAWTSNPPGFNSNIANPIVSPSQQTTYYLTVSDSLGCSDIDSVTISVIPPPTADFSLSADSVCPLTTVFTINNSLPGLISYHWYIDDSLFSVNFNDSLVLPSLSDSLLTEYVIKLVITAGTGCVDSISKSLFIFPEPKATFSIDSTVCANDNLQALNSSLGVSPLSFTWTVSSPSVWVDDPMASDPFFGFPDNQSGVDSTYVITLFVTSNDGCVDTVSRSVLVRSRPTADFDLPAALCGPTTLQPIDQSLGGSLQYAWVITPNAGVVASDTTTSTPSFGLPVSTNDTIAYVLQLTVTDAFGCEDTITKTYVVYPTPTADFGLSISNGCHPLSVDFTDASGANYPPNDSLQYAWDFGNGLTSTMPSPSNMVFTNTGVEDSTYVVTLIVTNVFGCSDTISDTVTVHPLPRAEVIAIDTVNCAPFVIDSTSISPVFYLNANATYTWLVLDVSGNILGTYAGPSAIQHNMPNDADTVIVRLVVTSPFGCANDSIETMFITIPDPVANFSLTPDSIGCHPLVVTVQDSSTPGVNHEWFINGLSQPTTDPEPTFTLNNLSNTQDSLVQITLVVTAGTGCTDTITRTALIKPQPLATFSIDSTVCANDTLQALNSSVGVSPLSFTWTVSSPAVWIDDPMASDPFFGFPDNQSGVDSTYEITLFVTSNDGCVDTVSRSVLVRSRPTADFDLPAALCGPTTLQPIDQSLGSSLQYAWVITPNAGVVASDTTTSTPSFGLPVSTNDTVAYALQLTVTDAFGCEDTITKTYVVYPTPTADFGLSIANGCHPLSVDFTDASSANYPSNDSLQYAWDFGNGLTSTMPSPSNMVFTNTGVEDSTYVVTLIVTNVFGCSDTISDTVTVHPLPRAEFTTTVQGGCTPFVIDSTIVSGVDFPFANASYEWIFSSTNGIILTTHSGLTGFSFTMQAPDDTVVLSLVATSLYNCDNDTFSVNFVTDPNPEAQFTLSDTVSCSPLIAQASNTSQLATNFEWYVDGVLESTQQNPQFTLLNSATVDTTYTITLIAISSNGCLDTLSQVVSVFPGPNTNFTSTATCLQEPTIFTDQTTGVRPIVEWVWDFGDGDSSNIQNPTHLYTQPGIYVVTLTVLDSFGCEDAGTDTLIVRPLPEADFSLDPSTCFTDTLCLNQAKSFIDMSFVDSLGGTVNNWSWDIGNNGIVDYTTQNITHTFADTGQVFIRFVVSTDFGCADTIIKSLYVVPDPVADFSLDTNAGCDGHQLAITNNSTGFIEQYNWTLFTIGTSGNIQTLATHTGFSPPVFPPLESSFTQDTVYYVALHASSCCAQDSVVDSIVIRPTPTALFVPSDTVGCSPLPITFLVDGQTFGNPDFVIFDFGDGSPIDTIFPRTIVLPTGPVTGFGLVSHVFNYTGPNNDTTYTVTLTAVNSCGSTSYSQSILVFPNTISAFFTASQISGCAPLTVDFSSLTPNSTLTNWTFMYDTISGAWGTNTAQGTNVSFTYNSPGIYTVAMSVTDGCGNDTMFRQINVQPSPNAGFTFTNNVCEGDTVFFTNTSTVSPGVIMSYQWDFGNGQSSNIDDPTITYDTAGVFQVCLVVFSDNGCPDTICQALTISPRPSVAFDPVSICFNEQPVVFNNLSTISSGSITFTQWDFGDGSLSWNFNAQHTYSAPGTYTVKLIHQGSSGCTDSAEQVIQIFETPTADFSITRPSGDSCGIPQTIQFTNTSSNDVLDLFWDFDVLNRPDSLTSNLVNPSLTFTEYGRYTVRLVVNNGFGCTDTIDKEVVIQPNPEAFFAVDTLNGCQPLTVSFTDLSTFARPDLGGINRWVYHFGDGNIQDGANPNAIHTYIDTGAYFPFLVVITQYGCLDTFYLPQPIKVFERPQANFILNSYLDGVHSFQNLTISGTQSISFRWDMGDGNIYFSRDVSHRYQIDRLNGDFTFDVCLYAETEFGCVDSVCNTLFLPQLNLNVPNALAPEAVFGGEPSIFLPKGHSMIEYHFQVFDYWGNLIFETNELTSDGKPLVGWNGRRNNEGEVLPKGVYVWKIFAMFEDGTIWPGVMRPNANRPITSGPINLIR